MTAWLLLGLALATETPVEPAAPAGVEPPVVEVIDVRVVDEPAESESGFREIVAPILEYGPATPETEPAEPGNFVGPVAPAEPPVVVVRPATVFGGGSAGSWVGGAGQRRPARAQSLRREDTVTDGAPYG